MNDDPIPHGKVHDLPKDLEDALRDCPEALRNWRDITALARTEWIAWIEDAKKSETRDKRIGQGVSKLSQGRRRPCCWPGYENVGKYTAQPK